MRMKKPFALLLALCMVFALAACSNNADQTSTNPGTDTPSSTAPDDGGNTPDGEPVTITVASFNIGDYKDSSAWDPIIEAFNAVYPNVTVKIQSVTYQDGDQQLANQITGGSAPDIVFEGPERIISNYAKQGLLVSLDDLWEANGADISDGIAEVSQLDGTYYMFPLAVAAHCMAINYEAFEAAGALQYIDEETRTWTTDDFVAACQALKDAMDAGTITMAETGIIYCGAQGGDQGTRALVNNLYSDYFVTDDGSSYNINSANNVKALQLLQDMVNNGTMGVSTSYAAAEELQAFANGTCAMTFAWNYSNYVSYAEQTQFTPFAMAFPSDDGVPELEMAGPYGLCVFDNKDQARIDAAKAFVDFVCNDQTAGVEAVKGTTFFPVHADWGDIYANDENADVRAPFALMSDYLGRYYTLTPGWVNQRTLWWQNLLQPIMGTGADVQSTADSYVEQANAGMAG